MPVTPYPALRLGSLAVGVLRLGLCFGFARNDPVDAIALDLLGLERETELLAHDAREEAAHRVLLPAGYLRDRGNCRSLGWLSSAITVACLEFERGVVARAVVA